MAVENPPIFLQAGSHSAEQVRRALTGMLGGRPGVVQPLDLFVSQNGTPNMSVNVATGQVAVLGSEATYQGLYLVENRGTLNLAIAAADSTNPRRDLVIVRVRDSAYSGASDDVSIEVVTGTPAGSPSDPSLPSGSCFVLARVAVGAGVTSITTGNITDLRRTYTGQYGLMTAHGGMIVCTSGTRPTSPYEGMQIYENDTDLMYIYNGSSWIVPYALGRIASATITANTSTFTSIVYPTSITPTWLANRRIRVHVHANVQAAGSGVGTSIGIANGAGTILNQAYRYQATSTVADQISVEYMTTSGAGGSTTYQLSAFATGSGAIITAATAAVTYIVAYDEGPA